MIFYFFPDAVPRATTILGIDFLEDSEPAISFKQNRYQARGTLHQTYGFTPKGKRYTQASCTLQSDTLAITDDQLKSLLHEYVPIPCIFPIQSSVQTSQGIDSGMADDYGPDPTATEVDQLPLEPTIDWSRFSLIDFRNSDEHQINYMWNDALQHIATFCELSSYHICSLTMEAVNLRAHEEDVFQPEVRKCLNLLAEELFENQA